MPNLSRRWSLWDGVTAAVYDTSTTLFDTQVAAADSQSAASRTTEHLPYAVRQPPAEDGSS